LLTAALQSQFSYAKPPQDWPANGLIVLPDMGVTPVISAINNAEHSIDLCLYHLDTEEVIDALIKAKERGLRIRIILNKPNLFPGPFQTTVNDETTKKLKEKNIDVHFLPDFKYSLTHYKLMVIDGDYALVQTFNFDDFNFNQARNFGLTIEDKDQVKALETIFDNDYQGKSEDNDEETLDLWAKHGFILGPKNQRALIKSFLESAKSSIYIYQQDLSDPEMGDVLKKCAEKNIKIYVLMVPMPFGDKVDPNVINHTMIQAKGGQVRFKPKKPLYVHAKVVIIDPDMPANSKMYVGSCNFWPEALSRNRELGVVTHNLSQIEGVYKTFQRDWNSAVSYTEAQFLHSK